jgi:uncharacterized protein (DUF433 family)
MATSEHTLHLDEAILRDVLALALHRDKLPQIVEAASEVEPGTSFTALSRQVAEKVGLPQEEAGRILTMLQNLNGTRDRPGLVPEEEWLAERIRHATLTLRDVVAVDPDIRSGTPVLRGTRFTVAQLLAELAEDRSIADIAASFRLDREQIRQVLESLATYLDRPAHP